MAEVISETALTLKRTFKAPREKVFRAWTDPTELKKWFRVEPGWTTPIAEVDLRVGGKYRLGMRNPAAEAPYVVTGTFREVQSPEKLVYTWVWEGEDPTETLVTVTFKDLGDQTEVELRHERFPTAQTRDEHRQGWTGCLEQLEKLLSTKN